MNHTHVVSHSQSSQARSPHAPTRPARATCTERLTCRGPNPRLRPGECSPPTPFPQSEGGLYFCADCGTNQCEGCELLLHQDPRFRDHQPRIPVKQPDPQLLCEGFSCQRENLADIRCKTCERSLCYACDYQVHLLSRKFAHIKVRFRYYLDRLAEAAQSAATVDEGRVGTDDEEEQYLSAEPYYSSSYEEDSTMMALQSLEPDIVSGTHKQTASTSVLLVDDKEVLKVSSAAELAAKLGCKPETSVKVVSIFGNTGEGKSHTLNHTFYDGRQVFQTSPQQESCTIGVWAAHCPEQGLLTIDTEGLLGIAENQNQRTRLLLKVLAVSDIVIFRTRAERLTTDLFTFLGDASRAYVSHFSHELKALKERCNLTGPISALGPAVIVFHETMHTRPLANDDGHLAVGDLKNRFGQINQSFDAFSDLQYVGIQTVRLPTCFDGLRAAVKKIMENSTVRSARPMEVIFQALKLLNDKFSGDIEKTIPSTFPDQYFTCQIACIACAARCNKTMNHQDDHACGTRCQYQHQYNNRVQQCKDCYEKSGREVVLTPQTAAKNESAMMAWAKFAWSGYVLECPSCGVIYQSRQYWYGNRNPDETVTRVEIVHVWPGDKSFTQEPSNTAQKMLDGLKVITETVSTYSARPATTVSDWMNDKIAPSYWVPNYKIQACNKCGKSFPPQEKKHHCRACGNGFCEECSSKTRPVPERGWGSEPVRVCDDCFERVVDDTVSTLPEEGNESEVTAWKVGEVVRSTLGVVATAMEYPIGSVLGLIKDSARPDYWTPDNELTKCAVCSMEFGPRNPIHHCRSCGLGVCNGCSLTRRPVLSRGWESTVRVCDRCNERPEL
ncbi:zinc finger FYVE domain-containing protein 1-like isoform X1 [Amblyomma americanum]